MHTELGYVSTLKVLYSFVLSEHEHALQYEKCLENPFQPGYAMLLEQMANLCHCTTAVSNAGKLPFVYVGVCQKALVGTTGSLNPCCAPTPGGEWV